MIRALYNENEPYAAQWLWNLVVASLIAPGDVDERSIRDLEPADLAGYDQCHFFAGIGVWSYALRLAGWPDDAPVWTGSCPCQPFSGAGRRRGFDDERHLWPAWFRLIRECRPPTIFGEQVASPDGLGWLDAVFADLEHEGYACGAADLCAAGVGAPHIRQRLYFVAIAGGQRRDWLGLHLRERRPREAVPEAAGRGEAGRLADTETPERRGVRNEAADRGWDAEARGPSCSGFLADSASERADERGASEQSCDGEDLGVSRQDCDARLVGDTSGARSGWDSGAVCRAEDGGAGSRGATRGVADEPVAPSATSGFWSDVEWLPCRDGKARPTQPGLFPLAHGVTNRVGKLRAYGNAIVPQVAATFIQAVMGVMQ